MTNTKELKAITIDSDDYTYPSRVTYEIRSCNKECSDPSGTNYTLENNMDVEFEIYNVLGQKIFQSNKIHANQKNRNK